MIDGLGGTAIGCQGELHAQDTWISDLLTGRPEIGVHSLVEENDVVVAIGTVRATKKDGEVLNLAMCDVFEMREAKIRKLTSYLVMVP